MLVKMDATQLEEAVLGIGLKRADFFPELQRSRMSGSKCKPVKRLIVRTAYQFGRLGGVHARSLQQATPMLDDARSNIEIGAPCVGMSAPTRRESVQRRYWILDVSAQVAIDVLGADVNENVHPL